MLSSAHYDLHRLCAKIGTLYSEISTLCAKIGTLYAKIIISTLCAKSGTLWAKLGTQCVIKMAQLIFWSTFN